MTGALSWLTGERMAEGMMGQTKGESPRGQEVEALSSH
jgi:hypothetical protein